jgi:hypothetical protein
MEGVQRVYDSGLRYVKRRYVPDTASSILYIVLYTVIVFYVTEFLMRGKITRLFYLGSVVMVIAMVYSGAVVIEDDKNTMPH